MTTIISPSGQKNNEFATWDLAKKYRAGDLVIYSGTIYEANDLVPENTAFVIGTTGATWTLASVVDQLEFTRGGIITETDIPTDHIGNTISITPSSGEYFDQQLLIYPTVGSGNNHLHLTSGNLYNTELFFGDDSFYVKLANTGNVVISTSGHSWNFENDGSLTLPGNLTVNGNTALGEISNVKIDGGAIGQVLTTNGSGVLTWTTAAGGATTGIITGTGAQDYQVATSNPTTRSDGTTALAEGDLWYDTSSADLKIWNADGGDWVLAILSVPPSIINGMSSVQAAPTNILFVVGGSTTMSMTSNGLELKGFTETVTTPAFNATFAPDVSLSTIVKFTATSNFTFNGFTNPVAGQSATIIITQDATGSRLMTSTMKFNGGIKTLSTAANSVDIISVFYDGTTYYASLTIGYV
jgi:hypothetical protein